MNYMNKYPDPDHLCLLNMSTHKERLGFIRDLFNTKFAVADDALVRTNISGIYHAVTKRCLDHATIIKWRRFYQATESIIKDWELTPCPNTDI